jgi:hypothetical protein
VGVLGVAGFQLTHEKLANVARELQKAQLLAMHLGVLKDPGTLAPAHVSFGKLDNVREARTILDRVALPSTTRSCAIWTDSKRRSPKKGRARFTRSSSVERRRVSPRLRAHRTWFRAVVLFRPCNVDAELRCGMERPIGIA